MVVRAESGKPLCLSSSEAWGSGFIGAVAEHHEQHVDPLSGQAEECLGVGLSSGPAFVVVGAGGGIVQGGERGQQHRAFQLPVAASGLGACSPWIEVPEDLVVGARPA